MAIIAAPTVVHLARSDVWAPMIEGLEARQEGGGGKGESRLQITRFDASSLAISKLRLADALCYRGVTTGCVPLSPPDEEKAQACSKARH